jgi:hypothetical protein
MSGIVPFFAAVRCWHDSGLASGRRGFIWISGIKVIWIGGSASIIQSGFVINSIIRNGFPWRFLGSSRGGPAALVMVGLLKVPIDAQELEPRAYAPSPIDLHIFVGALTFNTGDLAFDPSGPISDADADIGVGGLAYGRTMGVFERSANAIIVVPYLRGDLRGNYLGEYQEVFRSGMGDPKVRFAINLYGAPAMTLKEFVNYKPEWTVGTSISVKAPLGQYDSTKLINIGANRWAFKPDIGIARTFGRWRIEGAAGVWLFTDNNDFFGGVTRSQEAIGSFQFHLIYSITPLMWIAYNANYYTGGRTSFGDGKNEDLQSNSRMGLTFSMPVNRNNTLKFSYSRGAFTTIGADFDSFGVAWTHIWGPVD